MITFLMTNITEVILFILALNEAMDRHHITIIWVCYILLFSLHSKIPNLVLPIFWPKIIGYVIYMINTTTSWKFNRKHTENHRMTSLILKYRGLKWKSLFIHMETKSIMPRSCIKSVFGNCIQKITRLHLFSLGSYNTKICQETTTDAAKLQ